MIAPLPGDIFKPGQVLNNTYEIEGILGRGGTGEVYRARNQISGRIVALKALNAEFSGNADYLELMKREEEMRDIIHDAVVRYSDNSRTADGHVFLVMDFVDGPSLNELLHRGNASPRDLLIVCHRVAGGLVATHARQIVHRDLSPDNIILRKGDPAQAVIIDFGIAKDESVGARTIVGNDFAGKYEYAAPEQMDGRAEPRSDLYALGASLLATYRGQVPNVGSTPGEVVRRKGKALDTAGVPEPLKELIDWLTQPDAAQRPANAAAVVTHLDEVLKPKGRQTVLTKPVAQKSRRGRRGLLFLVPVLAIVIAAVVLLPAELSRWFPDATVETPPVVPEQPVEPSPESPQPPPDDAATDTTPPPAEVLPPPKPDLQVAAILDLLGKLRACGPLAVDSGGLTALAPAAAVIVSGKVASEAERDKVIAALANVADGRQVRFAATLLTAEICRILELLPETAGGQVSTALSHDGGQGNFTGVYSIGDMIIADILLSETMADQHIWAFLVDNKTALNILPNVNFPETRAGNLGNSAAGLRKVRLLYTSAERKVPDLWGYEVTEADIGKKLLVVMLSPQPLFPGARPATESVESMAEALEQVLLQPEFKLTAISTSLLDLRE